MIDLLPQHRVWSSPSVVSHHYPVCFEWMEKTSIHNFPFKFNHAWLLDEYFTRMVKEEGTRLAIGDHSDEMDALL